MNGDKMNEADEVENLLKKDLEIIKKVKEENRKLRKINKKLRDKLVKIVKSLEKEKKEEYEYEFDRGWKDSLDMKAEKVKEVDPGEVEKQVDEISSFIEDV